MFPILNNLVQDFNLYTNQEITVTEMGYIIRQIHLAHGCHHRCLHCFANAPSRLKSQMSLENFARLANEMGQCLEHTKQEFDFLYFGASTDPSMVKELGTYLQIWLDKTPSWHQLKLFTHGWMLDELDQVREMTELGALISRRPERFYKVALSFDGFSFLARSNWDNYLQNVGRNLIMMKDFLPVEKLRLEVMYPFSNLSVEDPKYLFSYWLPSLKEKYGLDSFRAFCMRKTDSKAEMESLKILCGLEYLLTSKVLTIDELILIYREPGSPFPGGRAKVFFKDSSAQYVEQSIQKQRQHSLVNIQGESTIGVSILPNGTVKLIDMVCYQELGTIGNGISYFE